AEDARRSSLESFGDNYSIEPVEYIPLEDLWRSKLSTEMASEDMKVRIQIFLYYETDSYSEEKYPVSLVLLGSNKVGTTPKGFRIWSTGYARMSEIRRLPKRRMLGS